MLFKIRLAITRFAKKKEIESIKKMRECYLRYDPVNGDKYKNRFEKWFSIQYYFVPTIKELEDHNMSVSDLY